MFSISFSLSNVLETHSARFSTCVAYLDPFIEVHAVDMEKSELAEATKTRNKHFGELRDRLSFFHRDPPEVLNEFLLTRVPFDIVLVEDAGYIL